MDLQDMLNESNRYIVQCRRLLKRGWLEMERQYDVRRVDIEILLYLYSGVSADTASDIAELGLYTKGHISQSVQRLTRLGLLAAEPDTADRRRLHLRPTPAARQLIRSAYDTRREVFAPIVEGISEQELQTFYSVLCRLNRNVADYLAAEPPQPAAKP